jgi:hypothetical protein
MCLAFQALDTSIGEYFREFVSNVQMPWALAADLQEDRHFKFREAIALEIVFAQRAKVAKRCLGIRDDRRPKLCGS